MLTDDIHSIALRHVHADGSVTKHPAGRVLVQEGQIHHLEDYHGLLDHVLPEGPVDGRAETRLDRLRHNPYVAVSSLSHKLDGSDPGEVPEAEIPDPPPPEAEHRPPSVFDYHRVGMDKPHALEVKGRSATLDGNPLSEEEMHAILENIQKKVATIRFRQHPQALVRAMEETFTGFAGLAKAGEGIDPHTLFSQVQGAVDKGHLDPKVMADLRRLVFEDPMAPGLGNKHAFKDFLSRPRPGVVVSMDGNGMKSLNDTHGHGAGDGAIRSMGQAAREAMDEAIGRDKGKLFKPGDDHEAQGAVYRSGGDEFVAHVPTFGHAATFMRAMKQKLDAVPPINGTHRLSMSFGFGPDYQTADQALYSAKAAKVAHASVNGLAPGQTPHFAHSLVPGAEGPVYVEDAHPMRAPGMDKLPDPFPPPEKPQS